jgi:hypothetical protein
VDFPDLNFGFRGFLFLDVTLAPPGYTLVHMTIISQDRSLVSYRGFRHRNAKMHKTCAHGIPDIPMRDLPMWLSYRVSSSWRPRSLPRVLSRWTVLIASHCSRLQVSRMSRLQDSRNVDLRCTDILTAGPSMALPPSCRGFGLRDSELQGLLVHGTSEMSILDSLQISATCPLKRTAPILPGTFTMEIPDLLSS